MITQLDHIAIAVPDLEAAIKRFSEDFGLTLSKKEAVAEAQTETAFFPVKDTLVELVYPMGGQGPVQKFIDKKGGGLHHLCFRSSDIKADMALLKSKGYQLLSEEPTPGAHNTLVAWIHPKSTNGVLIEIAQHMDDNK